MKYRVAINGYGRIGQAVLRALYEGSYRKSMQVVALNELSDIDTIAYLTRYDTTHGRFPGLVRHDQKTLYVNGDPISIGCQPDPKLIDWRLDNIDLLLECSGSFTSRSVAEQHIAAGAPKLLFSQPAESSVDKTIIFGVNEDSIEKTDTIVSAASCTTNCIVPVLKLLQERFGIEQGFITTIHSAMNDQPVIDAYNHTSLRLTRAALSSIIPVETSLGKGIDRILPDLSGKFKTSAIRVPTLNVSAMNLTLSLQNNISAQAVNELFAQASQTGRLRSLLGYTDDPHASVDFNHDSRSVVIDGSQTQVTGQSMLRLLCWFDNEWAFANRMLDFATYWLQKTLPDKKV